MLPGSVLACRSQPACSLAPADYGHSRGALSVKYRYEILSLTSLAVWSLCPLWFTGLGWEDCGSTRLCCRRMLSFEAFDLPPILPSPRTAKTSRSARCPLWTKVLYQAGRGHLHLSDGMFYLWKEAEGQRNVHKHFGTPFPKG